MDKKTATALANMKITDPAAEPEEEDETMEMPAVVARRVIGLKKLHDQVKVMEGQYKIERLQLEAKYRELKKPLFDQRTQIVAGTVEPSLSAEELAVVPEDESTEEGAPEIKGIPGFWCQSLCNSSMFGGYITEEDIPALNALADIQCIYNENMASFTLVFHFNENAYFSDKMLSKTYNLEPDLLDEQAPALSEINGSEIHWKSPETNLCVGIVQKKQKGKSGKRKGQVRYIQREEPKESFFHFFGDPVEEDEEEEGEEEDDDKARIKLTIEEDYEMAHTLRTEILPNAVMWYTGEAVDDDEDFEGEDEDDEDDDDEDDDDDEEEDKHPAAAKKKAIHKGKAPQGPPVIGAPGQAAENPECKQN